MVALLCAAMPLGLAAGAAAAQSGAPLYQVEVVIFSQPAGTTAERPPSMPAEPRTEQTDSGPGRERDPEEAPETGAGADVAPMLPRLPESLSGPAMPLDLAAVAARLNRGGYHLLWHQGWVQAPFQSAAFDLATLAALGQGPAVPGLAGTISLTAGRFLHLGVEIELQSGAGLAAELRQRHRLKPGVEHYFDGPHIGLIAVVKRVVDTPDAAQSAP